MKRKAHLTIVPALVVLAFALAACGLKTPPSPAPAEAIEEPGESPAEAAEEPTGGEGAFQISPDETEARFIIDEILNDQPKTVVGTTNSVSGQIVVDYADTSGARVDSLSVDLSTLATDNDFRNLALHDFILMTGEPDFQFSEFVSKSVSGLPESLAIGETYEFQLTGDLTIHGVTREVTFDASITPVSETRLEGSASATVEYADFDVRILQLPSQVASVEDTTTLEIDLVAVAG